MTLQLEEHQKDFIKQTLEAYLPDTEFWLFGSRIKGTAKRYSDLDVAVISSKPIELGTLTTLEEIFADSDLPFKIDLLDWCSISQEFQTIIKENHIKL